MNIGETIKHFRIARKMTQEQLAQESGINLSTLRKYEIGERKPKSDQLMKLSHALGVSIYVFMDFDFHTMSDLFALIFKMQEQLAVKFNVQETNIKEFDPDSISLSFDNDKINQRLCTYLSSLKQLPDTEFSSTSLHELENQFLNDDTPIQTANSDTPDTMPKISPFTAPVPISAVHKELLDLLSDCTLQEQELILKSAHLAKDCLRERK